MKNHTGRLTIPTDIEAVETTLELMERWGADALRDCDGTRMPDQFREMDIKKYATYYTTRKDNKWAKNHPNEIQQMYIMSEFCTATSKTLSIDIMEKYYQDQFLINDFDDVARWWEVIDRTAGEVVPCSEWSYDQETKCVILSNAIKFHAYTISFLVYIIWDPVHMYNSLTNEWEGEDHQFTYDVRLPKTQAYVLEKLKNWITEHPEIDVIRFTTFFHQFTLMFDDHAREKFVDWFGYSASVSPYILEQFEQEVGYRFRPEYIVQQGYHNSTFCVPTKQYKDFLDFQQREVARLIEKFVEITHNGNKEVMMFLGDHWIGTEPYGAYFKHLGIDAVVGSVGNGTTLRLISEIPGVRYTEGRFLPYFFPDTFYEGGNPVQEAKTNWICARRAILRKPVDRIGYGGYLQLAAKFPDFVDYIEHVADEFREIYDYVGHNKPYCAPFKVTILNAWGKLRSWGTHMVAHAKDYKQYYSYSGILEALSGMPFEVDFISFDDILNDPDCLKDAGVIINAGDAYTAFSGGEYWDNEIIVRKIREFVDNGGGFIGVGEPSAYQKEGHYFQLYDVLGVDKEIGFGLSTNKYNWDSCAHDILYTIDNPIHFGEEVSNIYAMEDTKVLIQEHQNIKMAIHKYGKGNSVYLSGLPFNFTNAKLLYRSIYYAAGSLSDIHHWYSENENVEINYYPHTQMYCIVNNSFVPQTTYIYIMDKTKEKVQLDACEIKWMQLHA